ncbi:MAG: cation-transporting P-type ATPase, partial [Pseudomonadales bacterium]
MPAAKASEQTQQPQQSQQSGPWHAQPVDRVLQEFGAEPDNGLDAGEVEERRQKYGDNRLTPGSERTTLKRFFSQFNNLFIYLLLAAGVVTALLGEWLDSGVIFAVVLIIAVIGFIQECAPSARWKRYGEFSRRRPGCYARAAD